MKNVALLLNQMFDDGVIVKYAVFGAVAQMRYTEAVVTMDIDVLVRLPKDAGLDILSSIYAYCRSRGNMPEGDAIRVGDWPVQFIPAFSALTEEALDNAEEAGFDGVPIRVVSALYLAVIALSVGRAKDLARVLALLEAGVVDKAEIAVLASRHGLTSAWCQFERRFGDA